MKKPIFFFFVFLSLFSLAYATNPGNGYYTLLSNSTTGLTETIELVNFYTEHLFVPYFNGSGISETVLTYSDTKACANLSATSFFGTCNNTDSTSEITFTNVTTTKTCNASTFNDSGSTCSGTDARGGGNYSVNESSVFNNTMAMYINISNTTLSIYNSTFDVNYRIGYFGSNSSGTSTLYIYNGTVWEKISDLASNGYTDETYSTLDPQYYAPSGLVQLKVNHSANSTTGNTGIVADYVSLDVTNRPLLLLNESSEVDQPMDFSINITNDSLSNASSEFRVEIYGGYFGDNVTGNTSVYLWNGSDYVDQNVNLSVNSYGWVNITGLTGNGTYVNDSGTLSMAFNRTVNSTTGNTGVIIDLARVVTTANTTVTPNANITMQASIDNVNWFNYSSVTNVDTSASLYGVNRTARFVRFNITEMLIANGTGNNFWISYAARGT